MRQRPSLTIRLSFNTWFPIFPLYILLAKWSDHFSADQGTSHNPEPIGGTVKCLSYFCLSPKTFIKMLDSWLSRSDGIFVSYRCCNSCHKFSDLKPHRCIILPVLDIRSLKSVLPGFSQASTGLVPSGNFRGESVSLLFSGCLHSLPPGPFLTSLQSLVFMAATPTTDSDPPAFFLWGS